VDEAPERHGEDVEAHVAPKQRVNDPEGLGMHEAQQRQPVVGGSDTQYHGEEAAGGQDAQVERTRVGRTVAELLGHAGDVRPQALLGLRGAALEPPRQAPRQREIRD
jgi:hypothetical protein